MANVKNMERIDAFPTCIYKFEHNFKNNERNDMNNLIASESISEKDGKKVRRLGTQENRHLHESKVFEPLVNSIYKHTEDVMEDLGYGYEKLEITNMWGNILKPNSSRSAHHPHTHSNNFLSGVFYLQSSLDSSPIVFFDPRPQASVFRPRKKEQNNLNSDLMELKFNSIQSSSIGIGIIFPSWLQHWVPQTNDERISIAWNIIVRGEYGEPNALQNAYI